MRNQQSKPGRANAQSRPHDSHRNGSGFSAREPDFFLWAADKKTNISGEIGVAWLNEDGTLRIKLNPFVVLDSGVTEYIIRMYPRGK